MSRGPQTDKSITPEGVAELTTKVGKNVSSIPRGRKGRKFKQNKKTQIALPEKNVFHRLNIADPTNLSSIRVRCNFVPTIVPISFRAIPAYCYELWAYFGKLNAYDFRRLDTSLNYAIFVKVFLFICEAKLAIAQIKCSLPEQELTLTKRYSPFDLRDLVSNSRALPKPLALVIEQIGNFIADDQPVVPTLAQTYPAIASGALNFAPTELQTLCNYLAEPQPVASVAQLVRELDDLPGVTWSRSAAAPAQMIWMHPDSVAFWTSPLPSQREFKIFTSIVSSFRNVGEFISLCDIESGDGSALQAIRYPESFDYSAPRANYYACTVVSQFEEQLAPAIQLGFEYRALKVSRFCGTLERTLTRGVSVPYASARAAIWSSV